MGLSRFFLFIWLSILILLIDTDSWLSILIIWFCSGLSKIRDTYIGFDSYACLHQLAIEPREISSSTNMHSTWKLVQSSSNRHLTLGIMGLACMQFDPLSTSIQFISDCFARQCLIEL